MAEEGRPGNKETQTDGHPQVMLHTSQGDFPLAEITHIVSIEPFEYGESVTTQYFHHGNLIRQDCQVCLKKLPPLMGAVGDI